MLSKIFLRALVISLCLHAGVLIYLSVTRVKVQKKISKTVEITYKAIKEPPPPPKQEEKKVEIKKVETPPPMPNLDMLAQKGQSLNALDNFKKSVAKSPADIAGKKIPVPTDKAKKIEIPMLKSEKITNPKYLSYNDMVRQKIRQRAYIYIDNPDFESGEVYLTFILTADGRLKDVKIISGKTKANDFLKQIGIKAIEESSPFPPFPKDLIYPELTFNVVISFEVKE